MPFRERRGRAEAAARHPQEGSRTPRLGGAEPAHARQRQPARHLRSRGTGSGRSRSSRPSSARCSSTTPSSAACRSTTSRPNRYTEDHRRLIERIAEQAGAVIHNSIVFEQTQEDSLTDPLTRPAEPAVDVRAPVARAVASRTAQERGRDHRHGRRRLQGQSTTPTVTTSATRRCARSPRRCWRHCGRTTSASATPATSSSSCWRTAPARPRISSDANCRPESPTSSSTCAKGGVCGSPSAPVRRSIRQDGSTYEALLTDADQRMYRDKATRRGLVTVSHATGSPEFLAADIFDTTPVVEPDIPHPHTLG